MPGTVLYGTLTMSRTWARVVLGEGGFQGKGGRGEGGGGPDVLQPHFGNQGYSSRC